MSTRPVVPLGALLAVIGACLPREESPPAGGGDKPDAGRPSATRKCLAYGGPCEEPAPDPCATDNGGCGPADLWRCSSSAASATCEDIDECATDNGGCGFDGYFQCTNNQGAPPTCAERPELRVSGDAIAGTLSGFSGPGLATVMLGSDGYLERREVPAGGSFRFDSVPPGRYFLSVDAPGHSTPRAKEVVVAVAPGASTPAPIRLVTSALFGEGFSYHWEEDASRAGHQQSAYVNQPPAIEFLEERVDTPDLAAAQSLLHDYNIILSDDDRPWSAEHAYRLLQTMKLIPQARRAAEAAQYLIPSQWTLTTRSLADDVTISRSTAGHTVVISEEAFVYAAPKLVLLDGVRGTFFSKRLHHALVRFVTSDGTDAAAVERILSERFGCTTAVPDYAALTRQTTGEDAESFQTFHPAELVELINMFEEMPQGYHAVPGLKYLARRKDGMPHPRYQAPAVAWALPALFPEGSYIELMDSAFTTDPDHMHRLILHEKAHFLWAYVFSQQLRSDWTSLGGWAPDPNDPDGWSTTDNTGFVTAYAHKKSPDEDMAESLSFYVLNPDALRSRSLPKFEFIRDRVMQGYRYVSRIRADLTFTVLNLYPDYVYPGKISRLDISVAGAPSEDKLVTLEIELHAEGSFQGASIAYLRVASEIGTYVDVYLSPVNSDGSVLRGQFGISKHGKAGYWYTDQIVVTDAVGNQRFEGMNDFGWELYIDNPLEDVVKPKYVNGSLRLSLFDDALTENGISHAVQRVRATWLVDEDRLMASFAPTYAALTNITEPSYALQSYGAFDPASSVATVEFIITEFNRSGVYSLPYLSMRDEAGNIGGQYFSASPNHQPLQTLTITTPNPDTVPPELSLNDDPGRGLHRILISATPTQPQAPNGETVVNIEYQARDDKSGLGTVTYRLLDPQGISHFQYHYHPNFYSRFFAGDPTAWAEYEIVVVLPVGSAPGTWGLQELVLEDKAGNRLYQSFVETVHFQVLQ